MTAAQLPAAARPAHRVGCPVCGWVGYRRHPWARNCPACSTDAAKLVPLWVAGAAPRRGRCCYLAHITPPYHHASHYCGFTTDLRRRWPEHLAGGYDPATHKATGKAARLLAAAIHHGHHVELVRVWYGTQARALEQRLKQRRLPGELRAGAARSLRPLCPLCNPAGWQRRYPDLPDPPRRPAWRRFRPDPAVWDADAEWDRAFPHLAYADQAPASRSRP